MGEEGRKMYSSNNLQLQYLVGCECGGEKCTQTLPSISVGLLIVVVIWVKQFKDYFRCNIELSKWVSILISSGSRAHIAEEGAGKYGIVEGKKESSKNRLELELSDELMMSVTEACLYKCSYPWMPMTCECIFVCLCLYVSICNNIFLQKESRDKDIAVAVSILNVQILASNTIPH